MNEEQKRKIANDLYSFYRQLITKNYQSNIHAPHIDKLATVLMEMKKGYFNRLCVAMPPRFSKSSMITLAYPLWLIIENPDLDILIVNSSASLSEKFGIQLRELFHRFNGFNGVYLSDVKHASNYLMFEDSQGKLYNGSIRLVGAGGSITGQDADYLIIDDPYSGFDDITPTLLQKKIDLV